jgi:hypothetical protein
VSCSIIPSMYHNACRVCSRPLGKQNRSALCRSCALKERWQYRKRDQEAFERIIQACRDAGPFVTSRFFNLLSLRRTGLRDGDDRESLPPVTGHELRT